MDNKTLVAIAQDYLKENGFTNNQYLIFRHYDADHPHLHLLVNRISFDGKVVSDSNNYKRSEAILRKLEEKYQLVAVKNSIHAKLKAANKDEIEMVMRTGKPSDKMVLQELINQLGSNKPISLQQFIRKSEAVGIYLLFNQASTGRVTGITYFYNGFKAKGQALGNSFTNHLITIRTIFNRAITAKLVSADFYPFGAKGKIAIKLQQAAKVGPEEWEIKRIEELDLSALASINNDARNIWLTEFYFAGMRVTDCLLLKWTDFQNGRLYYQMSKNGEHGSVKVPDKAKAIIEQYRSSCGDILNNPHGLVFPLLQKLPTLNDRFELRRQISYAVSRLNKAMAGIMQMINSTKSGSQHKAKHAFAQRAEEKEIHPKVLQKLYRHESILTTMIYQSNFSFRKADDAVDSVLNF